MHTIQCNFITSTLTNTFTAELEKIRAEGFGELHGNDLIDSADLCSNHIVIKDKQSIVATVRITPSARVSILQQWFGNEFSFKEDQHTIGELTRGAVVKKYQGVGLYKLMMTEALLSYQHLGLNKAICAARLDLPQLPFLYRLGFVNLSQPLNMSTKLGPLTLQPLELCIHENVNKIIAEHQIVVQNLIAKNINFESRIQ